MYIFDPNAVLLKVSISFFSGLSLTSSPIFKAYHLHNSIPELHEVPIAKLARILESHFFPIHKFQRTGCKGQHLL